MINEMTVRSMYDEFEKLRVTQEKPGEMVMVAVIEGQQEREIAFSPKQILDIIDAFSYFYLQDSETK